MLFYFLPLSFYHLGNKGKSMGWPVWREMELQHISRRCEQCTCIPRKCFCVLKASLEGGTFKWILLLEGKKVEKKNICSFYILHFYFPSIAKGSQESVNVRKADHCFLYAYVMFWGSITVLSLKLHNLCLQDETTSSLIIVQQPVSLRKFSHRKWEARGASLLKICWYWEQGNSDNMTNVALPMVGL